MNTNQDYTPFTPNTLWSTPLDHPPTVAPTVAGDLLLIPTHQPDSISQTAALHALDLSDGVPRWRRSFDHAFITGLLPYPHTPTLILLTLTSANVLRSEGALIALDAAGEEHARWSPGVQRVSAPALARSDGFSRLCLTADARTLIVLDLPACQEQARIPLEAAASLSAPAVADNVAYVPCKSPHLLAVPLDGQAGWRFDAPDAVAWLDKTPLLVGERLFTVLSTGAALALRAADGALLWRVDVGPAGKSLSAPTADGQHLYVGARDGLHALDLADGAEAWAFSTSRRITAAPVVHAGVVYAAGHDHHVYALDAASGRELWRRALPHHIEHSPALATCGETPCLLAADHGGALVALARPLSAAEHEAAGNWIEAASAYAALDQPARAAGLLQDHGEPLQAAELWQAAGEPERAAQQYGAAGAWQPAADLWAALGQPLRQAQALVEHARALETTACPTADCAAVWETAAQLFDAEGEPEQAAACQREVARCLQQPIITMDVEHEGLVLNTWSRLQFTVRNEGYGPASNLVIRASGDQFEGQVMHTQRIVTLRSGHPHTAVLDVCPREPGDFVPLRVRAEYHDHAGELRSCEHTIYLPVARTAATRQRGGTISVFGIQDHEQKERKMDFLRSELAKARENLALIRERKSEYVMDVDVPLQLIKRERDLIRLIADLEAQLAQAQETPAGAQPTPSSSFSTHIAQVAGPVHTGAGDIHYHASSPQPPEGSASSTETIKILFLAANPSDTTRLRLDEESRAIDQALRQAQFRDRFDVRQHWAVRVGDVQELLLRHQPHIVHFSGHGGPSSAIILEDAAGRSHPVSVRALSTLFSVLKDNVRCVVLNACFSEQQAQAIAQHIDCVVGMSTAIGDAAAIRFAAAFYQALGYGRDVKTAFDLGCVQIDLENLGEQDTPQLLAIQADPTQITFVSGD